MPHYRIPFSTGYGLVQDAILSPWDQAVFDRVERRLHRLLPDKPLDQTHPDDLYFAGRFYFMAGNQSGLAKYHALAKRYFAAAVRNAGDHSMGTICDWEAWLLIATGTRREKIAARHTLWRIIEHATIDSAAEAALTLDITSRSARLKAKAYATALARYEKICEDLKSDLKMHTENAKLEERAKARARVVKKTARRRQR